MLLRGINRGFIAFTRRLLPVVLMQVLALSGSFPAWAQTTQEFFLHGTGSNANPSTLFLDNTSPTATTAKYKDSAGINFSGGNLWQAIGTWPTTTVPAAGILTDLSPAHVWLGLKNSDDQGTQFDLRVEVDKNGALISSGQTLCISGVTSKPGLA